MGTPGSKEQELLLAAISLDRTMDVRILEILAETVDWESLFRMAVQQGIFSLLYHRLMIMGESLVPVEVKARWNKVLQANLQHNLRRSWKMAQFVDLLAENEIECLVLKGPAIALQVYGELALRAFSDIDILIRQKDFSAVYDLLIQSG